MLLLMTAALSILLGLFVIFLGQDKRVKTWFFLVCLSCTALAVGLHMEVRYREWAYLAAKINMTAALLAATCGFLSARVMCGLPFHLPVLAVLGAAALVNLVTVWLTDWYFTGGYIDYPWGVYVAGRIEFVANPLLVTLIALYALTNLVLNFRKAHPLDKNRTGFLFLAYFFLSLSLFDYLPHFHIDLFGGPVSGISIPLFLATFGYASFRYRLIEFRVFVGRTTGYVLTALLMVGGYIIFHETSARMHLSQNQMAIGAALLILIIYIVIGTRLPQVMEKALRRSEPDYRQVLEKFSNELSALWDESKLLKQTTELCAHEFHANSTRLIEGAGLAVDPQLSAEIMDRPVIETEVFRRSHALAQDFFPADEIILPVSHGVRLSGALVLGKRDDGKMYTRVALQALRMLGNIFSLALANIRSASELQKRHQLDRYLAPQVVERVLSGDTESINRKQRVTVTTFFSDLKGFTELADHMNPEDLATVLNEYLSEMAEIAFQFGGTVDKFIGDAVMVFFGAPVGNVTAELAKQCVAMAIEMQRRTPILNARWLERRLLTTGLTCRIGIHTGEATVGSFGSASRVDYTAIGSSVNLASRLEGKCTPGKILISEETNQLVKDLFVTEARGSVEVKGFARPIAVYEVDPEKQGTERQLRHN